MTDDEWLIERAIRLYTSRYYGVGQRVPQPARNSSVVHSAGVTLHNVNGRLAYIRNPKVRS